MTDLDWPTALIGGALIGLSATLLMLLLGRIAGVSGILAGCFTDDGRRGMWRIAFILGLVVAPLIAGTAGFSVLPPRMPASLSLTALAGLLVGFGTRLGSGCTSGHGVCGIARLSPRSLAATAVFLVTATIVVAVTRHVIGG
jgi:hypothetical protein